MRATSSMHRVEEPAGATVGRPRRGVCRWALAGFGFGVVAASAYLLLDGEYLWSVPLWARIVFFPGFQAGYQVREWGLSEPLSKVVGVLEVGLAYASIGVLLGWVRTLVRAGFHRA